MRIGSYIWVLGLFWEGKGRRGGIRTTAGVGEDHLMEEDGEEGGRDVGQRGDGSVRASAGRQAPDGEHHQAGTNITRRVGRNCKKNEDAVSNGRGPCV